MTKYQRAEGCFGEVTERRLMEDDRQTDEQTDGEWVRVLDVTNGQAGQARGRERRLYSPGETGLILTYALEWNEDWHDLLIWAVTAHDDHGRSPVTLLQAPRTSCHQDRSKIEIHFLLGVDLNRATGLDFHLSLYRTCLCGTCSAVVVFCIAIKSYNTGHVFAYLCFSIAFCFKLGAICCEGEERACFSTDSENAAHQYRIPLC